MNQFVQPIQRQVGWFLLLGLGAVVAILLVMSVRSDLFADKFRLHFQPPTAGGFYIGQPVRMQGFVVGRIADMKLQEDGAVRIDLAMLERYRPMLHQGSAIQLERDGLIGEQQVIITRGDAQLPTLSDDQQVGYLTSSTIEQLLRDVRPAIDNANIMLAQMAELTSWMNDPDSDIRKVMSRLNELSSQLNGADIAGLLHSLQQVLQSLQSLSSELDKQQVAKHLADSLSVTTRILTELEPISKEMSKQGPETIQRIGSLIEHVDRLSASLDIVASDLAELTPELPGMARESRQTIQEMRDILSQLKRSWLLGGGSHSTGQRDGEAPVTEPVLEMQP